MPRPTKYKKEFPRQAEELAKKGYIDEQIAAALGVHVGVYYVYQKKYPEFKEAIARGKAPVDAGVQSSLLKRAMGYDITERVVERTPKGEGFVIKEKIITKHIPPDVDAIKTWLMYRLPHAWGQLAVKRSLEQQPPETKDPTADYESACQLFDRMTPEERLQALRELSKEPT